MIIFELSSFVNSKSELTFRKVRFWSAFMSKFGQKKVRILIISAKIQQWALYFIIVFFKGVYRWEESHQEAEYTNWANNNPRGSDSENCIFKSYVMAWEGWNDTPCSWSQWGDTHGEIHALCQVAKEH